MKRHIMLALILLAISGCTKAPTEGNGPKLVVHQDFSIEKPAGWQESDLGLGLYRYTEKGINATNPTVNAISVLVTRLRTNTTLSLPQRIELGLTNAKRSLPDLEVTRNATHVMLGTQDALGIQFIATNGAKKMVYNQIFLNSKGKMYTLTYTCESGKCTNAEEFKQMANSFLMI
jgi:hypothetical protein